GRDTSKMEVIAITDKIQKKSEKTKGQKNKNAGKGGFTIGEPEPKRYGKDDQTALPFEIGEIEKAIYAKLVQKVGNRHHWEDWANDIAKIARTHIDRITGIVGDPANAKERAAFNTFAGERRSGGRAAGGQQRAAQTAEEAGYPGHHRQPAVFSGSAKRER
ncbi:MAG: hypothetical protein U1E02_23065, partial [Hydrogenophaga sp.]|nr:hypothetical protein [Hydrogenophaga sp.]